MEDIDLTHELALIEDQVRTDIGIIRKDIRNAEEFTEFTRGFDSAVLKYAVLLGLLDPSTIYQETWVV